jgi:hypothetical protein
VNVECQRFRKSLVGGPCIASIGEVSGTQANHPTAMSFSIDVIFINAATINHSGSNFTHGNRKEALSHRMLGFLLLKLATEWLDYVRSLTWTNLSRDSIWKVHKQKLFRAMQIKSDYVVHSPMQEKKTPPDTALGSTSHAIADTEAKVRARRSCYQHMYHMHRFSCPNAYSYGVGRKDQTPPECCRRRR